MSDKRKRYRLPPCPDFDVEGTEQWLTHMAAQGWQLAEEGIFCGVACFEAKPPARLRFRLDASPASTGILGPNGGLPEEEVRELYGEMGWRYVANRGQFHIYCTADPAAPELHTDPSVEVLALERVRARRRDSLVTMVLWLVVYPLLFWRNPPLLTMVEAGTWFILLGAGLALWALLDGLRELLYYRRFRKSLTGEGEPPGTRPRPVGHVICKLAKYGLILAWFCLLLHGWSVTVMDEDKVALEDYRGEVPFATMADLAGEDAQDYRPTMQGMSFNAVRAWSDVLAPRCMKWAEHAAVTEADGNVLDGGLYVSYYELRSEALAPWLLKELYHKDMREVKEDQPLELPPLAADQAAAYRDRAHTPTLIFRKGRVVVRASFYSFSPEGYGLPDWAPILADSVGPD